MSRPAYYSLTLTSQTPATEVGGGFKVQPKRRSQVGLEQSTDSWRWYLSSSILCLVGWTGAIPQLPSGVLSVIGCARHLQIIGVALAGRLELLLDESPTAVSELPLSGPLPTGILNLTSSSPGAGVPLT